MDQVDAMPAEGPGPSVAEELREQAASFVNSHVGLWVAAEERRHAGAGGGGPGGAVPGRRRLAGRGARPPGDGGPLGGPDRAGRPTGAAADPAGARGAVSRGAVGGTGRIGLSVVSGAAVPVQGRSVAQDDKSVSLFQPRDVCAGLVVEGCTTK